MQIICPVYSEGNFIITYCHLSLWSFVVESYRFRCQHLTRKNINLHLTIYMGHEWTRQITRHILQRTHWTWLTVQFRVSVYVKEEWVSPQLSMKLMQHKILWMKDILSIQLSLLMLQNKVWNQLHALTRGESLYWPVACNEKQSKSAKSFKSGLS